MFHDSNVVGEILEESAQINSSESKKIDSLRLELERANEDLNSKKYEIECMEKGIEVTYEITNQERDALSSMRLNLMKENSHL